MEILTALIAGGLLVSSIGVANGILRSLTGEGESWGEWWWRVFRRRYSVICIPGMTYATSSDLQVENLYRFLHFFRQYGPAPKTTNTLDVVFEHTSAKTGMKECEKFDAHTLPFELEFYPDDKEKQLQFFVYPIYSNCLLVGWVLYANPYFGDGGEEPKLRLLQLRDEEIYKNPKRSPKTFPFTSVTIPRQQLSLPINASESLDCESARREDDTDRDTI